MNKFNDSKPQEGSVVFVEFQYNPNLNGLYTLNNEYWESITNEATLRAYEKDTWSPINNENPILKLMQELKREKSKNSKIIKTRDKDINTIMQTIERDGIHESLRRAWEYGYYEGTNE